MPVGSNNCAIGTAGRSSTSLCAQPPRVGQGKIASAARCPAMISPQRTPDGRYIIVDGVLWRASNPALGEAERAKLVADLVTACRDVGTAKRADDAEAERDARARVHAAKVALGERGPVWWTDGAPDYNRRRVENTHYAGAVS